MTYDENVIRTELAQIKARLAAITPDLESIAHAPTDQAKLIAALEAVEGLMQYLDEMEEQDRTPQNASAGGIARAVREVIAVTLERGKVDGYPKE